MTPSEPAFEKISQRGSVKFLDILELTSSRPSSQRVTSNSVDGRNALRTSLESWAFLIGSVTLQRVE